MNKSKISRQDSGLFSDIANELVYNQSFLKPFIQEEFSLEAFGNQIKIKSENYAQENRSKLYNALAKHYNFSNASRRQQQNLDNLALHNTFTVTTGHQLSLLTGPLYFVIKILHTVRLCEELTKNYPNQNFVPIFWMASEDHDFAEINQVNLFNKKLTWETNQTGAVGRFTMENWKNFIDEIIGFFNNKEESEVLGLLEVYTGDNLSEATFRLVNALFQKEGVLVLDADDAELKKMFEPAARAELLENRSFKAVQNTNLTLESAGFSAQAHAREINLFVLKQGLRERIQQKNDRFYTESGDEFSKDELLNLLEKNPKDFSPNVILRPLYQETILPNLCYVGGGGEIAYWLQLKGVFEANNTVYPLIQVRNSLLLIDDNTRVKMDNVGWSEGDLFRDVDVLKKEFVLNNSAELDFTKLRLKRTELIRVAQELVESVDTSLKTFAEAEMTRLGKQLDNLEQKLIRTEKAKHEKSLKQMDQIKDKLFPNGGLQERSVNFFNFCADGQIEPTLRKLKEAIDPFEKDFILLYV